MSDVRRKLTAVLIADVQGYARLMEIDEETTRHSLNKHRARLRELVESAAGRVIDTSGDSVLAGFDSVKGAVECAVEFQREVKLYNVGVHHTEQMEYRIGVNVGDVLQDGAGIYGDAVNIAARIQELAPPGGVCVSGAVRELVEGRVRFGFQFLREQRVKNKSRSVRVFRVLTGQRADLRTLPGSVPLRLTLSDEPGIAVLPFVNRGGADDRQYLGDGIAEDIITELSRFRSIHVMARATSFSYRDESDRYRKLLEELNVQYALEGSIRSVGSKTRITAQLVECETGKQIWGDHYTHDADAIFDVQDEVVSLIVSMLENRLLKDRMRLPERSNVHTHRAYDHWLKGNQAVERMGADGGAMAESWFNKAIELDPEFSRAYTSLASIHYLRAIRSPGAADWESQVAHALELSRTAVRFDASDGRAHANVGWGCLLVRDFEAARHHYDLAGDINPNDADILMSRARADGLLGVPESGIELATRALRLNPVHPAHYLDFMGEIKFFAGRYDDCVHTIASHSAMAPEYAALLAAAHGLLGARSSAREATNRFVERVRASWQGEGVPDMAQCLAWLDRLLPLKNPQDRRRLFDGLYAAGVELASSVADGDGAHYRPGSAGSSASE